MGLINTLRGDIGRLHRVFMTLMVVSFFGCDSSTTEPGGIAAEGSGEVSVSEEPVENEENGTNGEVFAEGGGTYESLCDAMECDDGRSCTVDSCEAGECIFQPKKGEPCDDGNACADEDQCSVEGECLGTSVLSCEDGNPCTSDDCDVETGCFFEPLPDESICSDGNSCTQKDVCTSGECKGVEKECEDDENPCTVQSGCDAETGDCVFQEVPDGVTCDDGNDCTVEDTCIQGACESGAEKICEDDNPCTDDSCVPKGGCTFFPNDGFCDDGSLCTVSDACAQGKCSGEPLNCEDGNLCTNTGCDPASGCTVVPVNGPCDDGNPCTIGDACDEGLCTSGVSQPCDDGNPCTTEVCDLDSGDCVFSYNTNGCDDGSICTFGDSCNEGSCSGDELNCDDGNPCTNDSCDGSAGCIQTPVAMPCDDGNPCTIDDGCADGACLGGAKKECDDENPCTTDSCSETDGTCVFTPTDGPCDDGEICTGQDSCDEGVCVGVPILEESSLCDGLDEDCDGETDESCSVSLGPGLFVDGGQSASTTPKYILEEAVGSPRVLGETSTGDFVIVPVTAPQPGGQP